MDDKELQMLLGRINSAEQARDSAYGELWQDCLRRYCSEVKARREGSNLFVPHTFMQCEVIKARVAESLFANRPYISALPREASDLVQAAKVQTLLDWQMNDRADFARLIGETVVGNMIIYGTAVTYTGWLVKTRLIRQAVNREQPLLDMGGQPLLDEDGQPLYYESRQVAETRQIIHDDPICAHIPLTDFYIDPEADDLENARYLGHKEYLSQPQLQDLADQGKYQIDWDKLSPIDDETSGGPDLGRYLLHHYWQGQRHLVILNWAQCVLDEENPFWHGQTPYDKCCYVRLPGEFYGMGVPEILASLQDELNTSRNQRIDYNSLALRRMWKLRKGCGLTARDLLWRQNGVLQVENMDDVQEINIQGLPPDAFANEAGVKQDMQDATGCHDILMGLSYANETATTTMTRDNNASLRFKAVVTAVVKDLLLPVARKFMALDQQFLGESRAIRLLNSPAEPLFQVGPEDLDGDYDISYCGTAVESLANKALNKEKALQAYSLALADPAYQADDGARLKLYQKVLEALDIKEAEALLPRERVQGNAGMPR